MDPAWRRQRRLLAAAEFVLSEARRTGSPAQVALARAVRDAHAARLLAARPPRPRDRSRERHARHVERAVRAEGRVEGMVVAERARRGIA